MYKLTLCVIFFLTVIMCQLSKLTYWGLFVPNIFDCMLYLFGPISENLVPERADKLHAPSKKRKSFRNSSALYRKFWRIKSIKSQKHSLEMVSQDSEFLNKIIEFFSFYSSTDKHTLTSGIFRCLSWYTPAMPIQFPSHGMCSPLAVLKTLAKHACALDRTTNKLATWAPNQP